MSVIKPVLHHVTIKAIRLAEMVEWDGKVVGCDVALKHASNAWHVCPATSIRRRQIP